MYGDKILKFRMPIWVSFLLLATFLSGYAFVIAEYQDQLRITKPFVSQLLFEPSYVKIESISLKQNYTSARYFEASVTILNYGDTTVTGVGYIVFYDAQLIPIARGDGESMILQPGQKQQLPITINWLGSTNLKLVASCDVGFMPVSVNGG